MFSDLFELGSRVTLTRAWPRGSFVCYPDLGPKWQVIMLIFTVITNIFCWFHRVGYNQFRLYIVFEIYIFSFQVMLLMMNNIEMIIINESKTSHIALLFNSTDIKFWKQINKNSKRIQAVLAICRLGIRGFEYWWTKKPRISRGNSFSAWKD